MKPSCWQFRGQRRLKCGICKPGLGAQAFTLIELLVVIEKNRNTSSLDWAWVDSAGQDSPCQPTEAHSRASYVDR